MIRIASALALLAALITPAHAGGYASALAVSGDACAAQGTCVAEQVQVQAYAAPVIQQQVVRQYVQPVQQLRVVQRVVQVPAYVQQQVVSQQAVGYGVAAQAQAFAVGGYGGGQQVILQQAAPRRGLFGLGGGRGKTVTKSRAKTVTRSR